jgi:hypothetical protein
LGDTAVLRRQLLELRRVQRWSGNPPPPPNLFIYLFIEILLLNSEIKKLLLSEKYFGRCKKNLVG